MQEYSRVIDHADRAKTLLVQSCFCLTLSALLPHCNRSVVCDYAGDDGDGRGSECQGGWVG